MIVLTYHAVDQFVSRCKVQLSQEAAWEYLEKQLPYANRLKQRSVRGDTLWSLPNGCYVISRRDGNEDVAVTFLKELHVEGGRSSNRGPTEEELELLLERTVSDSIANAPTIEVVRDAVLRFEVSLRYTLGADNAPIAKDRIEQALRTAIGSLKSRAIAKATVESILIVPVDTKEQQ